MLRTLRTVVAIAALAAGCTPLSTVPRPGSPAWVPLDSVPFIAAREAERAAAYRALDTLAIARILSPDYRVVGSERGRFGTFESAIAAVRNHLGTEPPIDSLRVDSATVRLAPPVAIVLGHEHLYMTTAPDSAGRRHQLAVHMLFNDTWQLRNGQWLLLFAQHANYDRTSTPLPATQ